MKLNKKIMVLVAAYVVMLLAMFILPLRSVAGYSITRNTLSELGAQFAPNAWIMNIVFFALALGSLVAGWGYFNGHMPHRIFLVLFTISLTVIAYFNHAPVNPDIQYDIIEDGWHTYFLGTAELSFIILSIATSFVLEKQNERVLSIAAGMSTILLSVLMSEFDQFAGVWQRLQFIISFGWLIYIFKKGEL